MKKLVLTIMVLLISPNVYSYWQYDKTDEDGINFYKNTLSNFNEVFVLEDDHYNITIWNMHRPSKRVTLVFDPLERKTKPIYVPSEKFRTLFMLNYNKPFGVKKYVATPYINEQAQPEVRMKPRKMEQLDNLLKEFLEME